MTLLVSCCLCLWNCVVFFKISGRNCVVSGKPSKKSDGNKFEKLFAWWLVLLTHVDIADIFGRLVNLLMKLLVSCCLFLWNCVVFLKFSGRICLVSGKPSKKSDVKKFWNFFCLVSCSVYWYIWLAREFAYDIVIFLVLLVLVRLCRVFKISGKICVVSGKSSRKSDWLVSCSAYACWYLW